MTPKTYDPLVLICEHSEKIIQQLTITNVILKAMEKDFKVMNENIGKVLNQIDKFMELDLSENKKIE